MCQACFQGCLLLPRHSYSARACLHVPLGPNEHACFAGFQPSTSQQAPFASPLASAAASASQQLRPFNNTFQPKQSISAGPFAGLQPSSTQPSSSTPGGFGNPSATPSFGSASALPVFGGKPVAAQPPPSFGLGASAQPCQVPQQQGGGGFGAQPQGGFGAGAAPSFGVAPVQSPAISSKPSQGFAFGAAPASNAPANAPFQFGQVGILMAHLLTVWIHMTVGCNVAVLPMHLAAADRDIIMLSPTVLASFCCHSCCDGKPSESS